MLIIEIKDNSLLLVEADVKPSKYVLKKTKTYSFSGNWKTYIANKDNYAELVELFKDYAKTNIRVHICLNNAAIIYRDLAVPKTNQKFMASLIHNEMTNALNLTNEYLIDYTVIGEVPNQDVKYHKVLVTAIQVSVLGDYLEFFKQIGLNITRINVGLNALIKYLSFSNLTLKSQNSLIADIGKTNIRQYYFEKGQYSFYRNTKLDADLALGTLAPIEEYADNIDKMRMFVETQGAHKELGEVILFGYQTLIEDIQTALMQDKSIISHLMQKPKHLENKLDSFDSTFIYTLGVLFSALYSRKKDINLLIPYNNYHKIKKYSVDFGKAFNPVASIVVAALLLFLTIKIAESNLLLTDINFIKDYLTDPLVSTKMQEIETMKTDITKIEAISQEISSIQVVLDSMPRFNRAAVAKLYSVKPTNMAVSGLNFSDRSIILSVDANDSTLFYQYVRNLVDLDYFDSVTYVSYQLKEGTFYCDITIVLKGAE